MNSVALVLPSPTIARDDTGTRLAVALLFLAAFLLRMPHFGDPLYQIDEQFYLLVGDRMLHGAIPFVDIWDRKPIGLFLLFAAIRLLPGDGILAYQLVATGCAWHPPFAIRNRCATPRSNSWLPSALMSRPIAFMTSIVGSS